MDAEGETALERATFACRCRYAMSEETLARLEAVLERGAATAGVARLSTS